MQAKLLRAIETRTFFRVGGVRKVEVNVRIVAATNRNLDTVIADGSFRSDLLYRINGFQISLPPLRERPEDIEPLTEHTLKQLGGTSPPEITDEARAALRRIVGPAMFANCELPGRGVLLANDNRITLDELPPEVARPSATSGPWLVSCLKWPAGASAHNRRRNPNLSARRSNVTQFFRRSSRPGGIAEKRLRSSAFTLDAYRRLRDYTMDRRQG